MAEQNSIVKQGFGSLETRSATEVASAAMSAMVEAEVKARYIMAMQNPRNIDQFREDLLKEVKRPYFVDQTLASGTMLKFKIPKGKERNPETGAYEQKYAEDVSIRFIELAMRCFKNIATDDQIIYESDDLRLVRVSVVDLENNVPKSRTVAISKTVEKKGEKTKGSNTWDPPRGRQVISQRMNSYNEPVYIVTATDEELKSKQNAEVQKTIRTLGKQLLPGDTVAEAIDVAEAVITQKIKDDPDSAKRKILDAFAKVNVSVKDIEEFLSHSVASISPKEIGELREIYTAVSAGESSWWEAVQNLRGDDEEPKAKKDAAATMAEKLRNAQEPNKGEQPKDEAKPEAASDHKPQDQQSDKPKGSGFGGGR